MATMTAEQVEQKKQQLKQLAEEVKQLKDELVKAGAWPISEDDLDEAAGGWKKDPITGRPIAVTADERLKAEFGKKFW